MWHWESYGTIDGPIERASSTLPHFSIQADIVAAALDTEGGHHLLGALPTGFGKSLPMMVLALLLPPGNESVKTMGSCKAMFHEYSHALDSIVLLSRSFVH